MRRPQCKGCSNYVFVHGNTMTGSEEGECRAHPPKAHSGKENAALVAHWPIVDGGWWCGEWKPA